ncbi:ROK family transcriptional regulator [Pisciglobus halotolerans]|uniref:Sugar kinase of the NBD/HSP70 family, may contain an N-terminal HTH domain n=1 Tax=Pisciglobus halotolerans TaxID=745365 RepID=A0A1I3DP55_9LACT|nr:ROK family transcriptional regulator [Pisciglobus halotolerans]SFH88443.1 Sugar kinase of the NBD/HSP70 family, may contain an N-terminal HTH domain [Pisciglobus halotolerans]
MLRGTFQLMKSVNKTAILNKIRLAGPISRADIAKETGITPPTVSTIVKELMAENLVAESRLGKSKGGRKPTLLLLKEDGSYVIGVDAGSKTIKAIVSDLVGHVLARAEVEIYPHSTNEAFLEQMTAVIRTVLSEIADQCEKVLGIGVAMHGVVEIESGISLYSSKTGLRNVPIKETLEAAFDLPVTVENNSRAMAIGEYWFGDYGYIQRFSVINIGRGVGSGLIVNDKLCYGAQDLTGEIGHVSISLDGDVCSCGNRGCFETFVSGDAIVKRAKKMIQDAPDDLTAEKVYAFAKEGKTDYIHVLEETGKLIGIGIINLVHTVNPDQIVLGGGVMKSADFLMPQIQQTIRERALTEKAKAETKVVISKIGDDATVLGAAALLLTELFY